MVLENECYMHMNILINILGRLFIIISDEGIKAGKLK